jgi:replicative DNA helicase
MRADIEASVIGGMVLDNWSIANVRQIVQPSDFANETFLQSCKAIYALADKNQPIDELTLMDELQKEQYMNARFEIVLSAIENCRSAANVTSHAKRLKDVSLKQAVLSVINSANEADTGAQALESAISQLTKLNSSSQDTMGHINDGLNELIKHLETPVPFIRTGLIDLDHQINGFAGGRLYVIGARPAMGKTALSVNIALQALRESAAVMFFSMEMPRHEISGRLACSYSNINTNSMKARYNDDGQPVTNMSDEDWTKATAAFAYLKDKPLQIDDGAGKSLSYLKNHIRTHATQNKKSLYIIDYLQLMQFDKAENHTLSVGEVSKQLKTLAREIDRPIILLSQLNRSLEQRPDKRPIMSDLRESGSIEQDADVIMMLYRDEVYNEESDSKGIAEILVRKNRQGETGKVLVKSELQYAKFSDLSLNRNYQ